MTAPYETPPTATPPKATQPSATQPRLTRRRALAASLAAAGSLASPRLATGAETTSATSAETSAGTAAETAAKTGAETSAQARARKPDLFDPETGLRIARYRGPTPADAPGARVVDAAGLRAAVAEGAGLLDVSADGAGVWFGPPEGWVGFRLRETVPGALWAPWIGAGALDPEMTAYADAALARLAGGAPDRPVVVFCIADCWMSWNMALRLVARGWPDVAWHPLGVDGWRAAGGRLARVAPVPPQG